MSKSVEECHICGTCWWEKCSNDADYTMDVELKDRRGKVIYDGKIDLCGGHTRHVHATRGQQLSISPVAIEQAKSLRTARVSR